MHLYIHVPFCDGKCAYCAFYSVPFSEARGDEYLDALSREIRTVRGVNDSELSTVYLGGGTPSVLTMSQLQRMTDMIKGEFVLQRDAEWTLEGSPNTLTEDKVEMLLDTGINRISLGIQTFDNNVLSDMARRHSGSDAYRMLEYLTGIEGLDAGCDLIAGLPGHTEDSWRKDLKAVCDLGLSHVSVYALSLEDGTSLSRRYRKGKLVLPDEDAVIERLDQCRELLTGGGLARYEVSNYALPGRECRHNLSYWRGCDYTGLGPGASSRAGLIRRTNKPDIEAYIRSDMAPAQQETVSREEDTQERLMYHFRIAEGVDLERFCDQHAVNALVKADWEQKLAELCKEGMLDFCDERYIPTDRGIDFADSVAQVFLD